MFNRSTGIVVITVKQYLNKCSKRKYHKCFIGKLATMPYGITFILNPSNFKNRFERLYMVILPQIK